MPKTWIPSQSTKAIIIVGNMGTGPVMAAYVIAQFNNIPLYGWLREGIEYWQVTSIDAATNYTAVFALFLNGCFCFISFAAVAAILAKFGPTRPRQWLTSDVNWPYHAWLVMGVVALLLDYVAVLMFLVPRSVFPAVFLGLILPLGSVGPFVCIPRRIPESSTPDLEDQASTTARGITTTFR